MLNLCMTRCETYPFNEKSCMKSWVIAARQCSCRPRLWLHISNKGFFPNTNSLTQMVKHWLSTCSLSGAVHRVRVRKFYTKRSRKVSARHGKCKYIQHAWSLLSFMTRSPSSFGVWMFFHSNDVAARCFYFCLYYSHHNAGHLQLLVCLRNCRVSSGPCWAATYSMRRL